MFEFDSERCRGRVIGQLIDLYIKQTKDPSRTLSDKTFLNRCLVLWPFSFLLLGWLLSVFLDLRICFCEHLERLSGFELVLPLTSYVAWGKLFSLNFFLFVFKFRITICNSSIFSVLDVITVITLYASWVQGTLILSASTVPAHFPTTDSEQFASILTLGLIRNCRIRLCGNLKSV